ncbi:hypothetical protein QQY24_00755 [Streptomyces sp. TG1A-8]|uniref:hypothetical protein n=1 Tax=Streptomyces sp. TG1A-8 TaxID=3051385 RepID=UPI00265B9BA9|nr:hypothetical protein [Streptomyces sp. TG1A-8]MDO0924040.1 hypothetical protein [Streptomyces sp. TG1A-8]
MLVYWRCTPTLGVPFFGHRSRRRPGRRVGAEVVNDEAAQVVADGDPGRPTDGAVV